jgi:hypothetical protein
MLTGSEFVWSDPVDGSSGDPQRTSEGGSELLVSYICGMVSSRTVHIAHRDGASLTSGREGFRLIPGRARMAAVIPTSAIVLSSPRPSSAGRVL